MEVLRNSSAPFKMWTSPSRASGLVMTFHEKEVRIAEKAFYERLLSTIGPASAAAVGVVVLRTVWISAEIYLLGLTMPPPNLAKASHIDDN